MPKREPRAEAPRLYSGHIPKLYAYLQQGSVTPTVTERYTADPWVWFGKRNLWPEQIRVLLDNCAPLERSAHALAMLMAGDGDLKFTTKGGEEVREARAALDSLLLETTWEDFIWGACYDIAVYGAPFLVVRRAAGGDIVRLDHMDVSRMRSGFINDATGRPDEYYLSLIHI